MSTVTRDQEVIETGRLPMFDRTLGEVEQEAHDIVERAKTEHRPEATFLLFSGGSDSQVALATVGEHCDAIVHINTGIGITGANEHAREMAARSSLPLIEMHPPIPYEELVLGPWRGMPGPGAHRFTFTMLKERCIEALLRDHRSKRGQRFLLLTGARAAESKRRMGKGGEVRRKGGQVWVNPLWHVQHEEKAVYIRTSGVTTSEVHANLHMSGECLCGAMADQDDERFERAAIRFFYPEFDRRLCDLEEACRSKGLPYTEWGVKRPDMGDDHVGEMCQGCAGRGPLFAGSAA